MIHDDQSQSGTGKAGRPPRPPSFTILLVVEALSSVFGFVGGIPLTIDPSGKLLGVPVSLLSSVPIPIHDFLLPGLWLLLVYGVGLAVSTFLLWSKRPHAWVFALALCIVWLGWISFELIFVGLSLFIGIWYLPQVGALALLITPGVRRFESSAEAY